MVSTRSESDSQTIVVFSQSKYFENTFIWEKMCFPLRFRKINKDIILYPDRRIWLRKSSTKHVKTLFYSVVANKWQEKPQQEWVTYIVRNKPGPPSAIV